MFVNSVMCRIAASPDGSFCKLCLVDKATSREVCGNAKVLLSEGDKAEA